MKSLIFSFNSRKSHNQIRINKIKLSDFSYFFKRYGLYVMFVALFLLGLVIGSVYAGSADKALLNSLDFLFTTNLDTRLAQNTIEIFCACFASDCIFLFFIFLMGTAPWGIPFMLLLVVFKGFGTGLTAGYLFVTYSLKGAGFYIIVLLPGTFLFCFALVMLSSSAFAISKQMFFNAISNKLSNFHLRDKVIAFSYKALSALIITFVSALIDALMWFLVAGMFNF